MNKTEAFHVEPPPISLTPAQTGALDAYERLIQSENARLGLVSSDALNHFRQRLLEPCLRFAGLVPFHRTPLSIADLGSGGGLPGIPMAVLWPSHQILLVDNQLKKCDFLRRVANELSLPNIEVLHGRVEKITSLSAPDLFTARFFKDLRTLAAWTRRWRKPGTRYLVFSGAEQPVEPAIYDLHFIASHPLSSDKVALEYLAN